MSSLTIGLVAIVGGILWKWLSAASPITVKPATSTGTSSSVSDLLRGEPVSSAAQSAPPMRSQREAFAAWLVLREVMENQGASPEEIETAANAVAKRILLKPKETPHEG